MRPQLTELALKFTRWISNRPGVSPLYEKIVSGLSCDEELLHLISSVDEHDFIYNRVMGAVHYLILNGVGAPLAGYYQTVTEHPLRDDGVYAAFREFMFTHWPEIEELIATRSVQINEIRRCIALLPALAVIEAEIRPREIAFVDVGACAGLNLLFDCFGDDAG